MKQSLTHIGDILGQALAEFRPSGDMAMTRIWEIWENAVGTPIAANAKPASFRDGILMVHVSSSAWMQQLRFYKQTMLESLNRALDEPLVNDIVFKIASIHY